MDIRKMLQRYLNRHKNDSRKCITSEGGEDLLNQKSTNCDIDYNQYPCSDCTKLLCLEIKNKNCSGEII